MRLLARAVLVSSCVFACACSGGLSRDALDWCASNATQVARVALEDGLMPQNAQFSDWKNGDTAGYQRACATAYNARLPDSSSLSPSLRDLLSPTPGSS